MFFADRSLRCPTIQCELTKNSTTKGLQQPRQTNTAEERRPRDDNDNDDDISVQAEVESVLGLAVSVLAAELGKATGNQV